jgi:hypothetical protein
MGFIIRVLGNILLGGFLLGINILIMAFFGLLRHLPVIVNLGLRFLNWFVRLSYRLYAAILNGIRPFAIQNLNFDILNIVPRVAASILLSLIFFMLFYSIAGWNISKISIGLAALHGLFVGFTWDGGESSSGLHLGENIQ